MSRKSLTGHQTRTKEAPRPGGGVVSGVPNDEIPLQEASQPNSRKTGRKMSVGLVSRQTRSVSFLHQVTLWETALSARRKEQLLLKRNLKKCLQAKKVLKMTYEENMPSESTLYWGGPLPCHRFLWQEMTPILGSLKLMSFKL